MAARNKWIWGASGTSKYAVKDLTEISIGFNPVLNSEKPFQVIAKKRIGYQSVLLKNYSTQLDAQKFINETFQSR